MSFLNNCSYCVEHHYEGLKSLLKDNSRSAQFMEDVKIDSFSEHLNEMQCKGLHYAKRLTVSFTDVNQSDVVALTEVGFTDGEILEINQVASYFNYVNRMVVGLGVDTKGDVLGLSPGDSDDANNWNHA